MPDFCSCGAQLPPDALFCHKCGKPQRDIIQPEIEANTYAAAQPAAVVLQAPPPQPQPLPLNFHNPIAVRIAFVAAASATLLSLLSPATLPLPSWLAAGFFAVYLYGRRTGFRLDVMSGVKIGWITGLIAYGIFAIILTVQELPDALTGHLGKSMLDQLKNSTLRDPAVAQQMTALVQNAPGVVILFALGVMFVFVTCLSMAGGALGAKLVGSPK